MSKYTTLFEIECSKEMHVKMSKKIADLTRVIDKLFRQFYEQGHSLSRVQKKCKQQAILNEKLEEERTCAVSEMERYKEITAQLEKDNLHLNQQVDLLKKQLMERDERENAHHAVEINGLKALLNTARGENEQLQLLHSKLVDSHEQTRETCTKHMELIDTLQKQLKSEALRHEKLSKEIQNLQTNYLESQNRYDKVVNDCEGLKLKLSDRIDSLQTDKHNLQSQIAQLLREMEELRATPKKVKKTTKTPSVVPVFKQRQEYWLQHTPKERKDKEVELLQQELQRYRLELMNRESNFNRVFTEHAPVHINKSYSSSGPSFGSPSALQFHLPNLHSDSKSFGTKR